LDEKMIRLNTVQTVGFEIRSWYYTKIPLLIAFWCYSSKPSDWCFLWLGWEFCIILYDFHKVENGMEIKISKVEKSIERKESKGNKTNGAMYITQQGLPNDAFIHICSFLHPRDVTKLACLNRTSSIQANDNELWKFLWYRDYGNVLLKWRVGRQVLHSSLARLSQTKSILNKSSKSKFASFSTHIYDSISLETSLEQYFEDFWACESIQNLPNQSGSKPRMVVKSIKEFYFVFGEAFTNYMLAGRNSLQECLLGLHGHIFDFTQFSEYHPGLVDPILWQCGRDATQFFEEVPHSRGARDIARELCVLVNLNYFSSLSSSLWGLYLPTSSKHLSALLANSNTIPISRQLQQIRARRKYDAKTSFPNKSESNCQMLKEYDEGWMLEHVLPKRVSLVKKRAPTLSWVRKKLDHDEQRLDMDHNKATTLMINWKDSRSNDERWRFYFDPIQQKWMQWNSLSTSVAKCNTNLEHFLKDI